MKGGVAISSSNGSYSYSQSQSQSRELESALLRKVSAPFWRQSYLAKCKRAGDTSERPRRVREKGPTATAHAAVFPRGEMKLKLKPKKKPTGTPHPTPTTPSAPKPQNVNYIDQKSTSQQANKAQQSSLPIDFQSPLIVGWLYTKLAALATRYSRLTRRRQC